MPRAAFRQAELERIIRAALKSGGEVHIDMKQLIVRVVPARADQPGTAGMLARDGKENWEKPPKRSRSTGAKG